MYSESNKIYISVVMAGIRLLLFFRNGDGDLVEDGDAETQAQGIGLPDPVLL